MVPSSRIPKRPPASARGVTLIEMMIVVAMVGIIAAIAVPNLSPIIHAQRVAGVAEAVANQVDRARRRAIGTGFCHRISRNAGGVLLLEERTVPNCITNLGDGNWNLVSRVNPEANITFQVQAMAGNDPNTSVLIFRPSGRLRGNANLNVADDGGRIVVTHPLSSRTIDVLVTGLGRVCARTYKGTSAMPSPVQCGIGGGTTTGTNPSCNAAGGETSAPLAALLLGLIGARRLRRKPKSRAQRPARRGKARGYLLIEVMVSGAILAVILGAAVTSVAAYRVETTRASRRAQAAQYAQEALSFAIAQWPPVCPPAAFDPPTPFTLTCAVAADTPITTASNPELNEDMWSINVDVTYPSATEEGVTETTSHHARVRAREQIAF